jgi:carbamoyltransferase
MIVLGLHGWDRTHDAAAALVIDGTVAGMIEEERLTRRKHALSARPRMAATALLQAAGLAWEDLDAIAYGWNLPRYLPAHGQRFEFANDHEFVSAALGIRPRRCPRLEWVDHHLAHAASAYHASGFDDAAVLVIDGQGEDRSISLFAAHAGGLRLVRDWAPSASLGFLYEAATMHCGFGFLEAGKTMGLASYGSPPDEPFGLRWIDGDLRSPLAETLEETAVVAAWQRHLAERFGPAARPATVFDPLCSAIRWRDDEVGQHQPAVARAAQHTIEHALAGLVRHAHAVCGHRRVVLTGGVALNCVANGRVAEHCEALFVPPFAHDAGAALGAALAVARAGGDTIRTVDRFDLGLDYPSAGVAELLAGARIVPRRVDDPAREAVERLVRDQVIGWFQGGSEVGPRALGRRSILALPTKAANCARVNRIKGREPWRPLAPSALESETGWMFGRAVTSPHMLMSLALTEPARRRLPAVTHVDGSTRVQTVREDATDPFAQLLRTLRAQTGTGVVLNTSFNAPGEPIVCSPLDALRTYIAMGLDAMIIGDLVLEKTR